MSSPAKGSSRTRGSRKKQARGDGCTHHWIIDPPNGAVSVGRCRKCGENREFKNSIEYSSWYGTRNTDQSNQSK